MNEKQLVNWEDWGFISANLIADTEKRQAENENGGYYSNTLFRDHSCASWGLDTTLERYLHKQVSIAEYHRYLLAVQLAFETFVEKKWDIKPNPPIGNQPLPPIVYDFMVYLRHHSFPTPLLDWTLSPYIAAFFAFQNSGKEKNVAIFTYNEYVGEIKVGWVGEPTICEIGSYINSHKRHFQQQGQYTYCKKKHDKEWFYCSHEEVFKRKAQDQDICTKYLIPSSEKNKALKQLDLMNINAFSLYGNIEGLAEMLAYREIMKKNL